MPGLGAYEHRKAFRHTLARRLSRCSVRPHTLVAGLELDIAVSLSQAHKRTHTQTLSLSLKLTLTIARRLAPASIGAVK
jgi:hypothetical protein